jgi:hypothetical protein
LKTRNPAPESETNKEILLSDPGKLNKLKGFATMSEQGLQTIETTVQKTHEWTARIAESMHMEKRDAWKCLRAGLLTLRDRLPVNLAVNFGAQFANARARPLLRGMGAVQGAD